MTRIPSLPLTLADDGTLATVEQGSAPDLAQRVHVLCVTRPGELDGRPGFGLSDQTYRRGGADLGEVGRQIAEYVPDADAELSARPDEFDQALQTIGVKVTTR